MGLTKLKIKPFKVNVNESENSVDYVLIDEIGEIEVLFNPNSYTITKSVVWNTPAGGNASREQEQETQRNRNAPPLSFGGGGNRVLTLNLFFDITEDALISDVRQITNKIVSLTRIVGDEDNDMPPVCEISWGGDAPEGSDFPFKGVITSLSQEFTLFDNEGKPLRANLTLSLKEYLHPIEDERETDPELTTRIVKRGDSLSSIAADVYMDAKLWRKIALRNNISNPRKLEIGQRLLIPRI